MAEREVDVFVSVGERRGARRAAVVPPPRATRVARPSATTPRTSRCPAPTSSTRLPLVAGPQQTPADRAIFGAFSDSAPDRWGRRLIGRAERRRVKREGGAARSFGETDYLLGVRDDLRQGALRFRDPGTREFLAPAETGVPSLLDLPRCSSAAERLERDEESEEELATLLRGGSSLGGARPKAHVLDGAGRIAIAKFPSPAQRRLGRHALGGGRADARPRAPASAYPTTSCTSSTASRYSSSTASTASARRGSATSSALTMLERADGERGSYLEIADVIARHSPSATDDLRELWRRIAFSVLISNFDDHLRNHGFLRTSTAGWSLSPAFDLNPDPRPGERHLTHGHRLRRRRSPGRPAARGGAGEFRLTARRRCASLGEVHAAVGRWRTVARRLGVADGEIELMAPAFVHQAAAEAADRVAHLT